MHERKVDLTELNPPFAVQLVRQVNYGPLESKRYFIPAGDEDAFVEVAEDDLDSGELPKSSTRKSPEGIVTSK